MGAQKNESPLAYAAGMHTDNMKLAMQARDRRRSKKANAQVNAYLVALKKHSADQTKVDRSSPSE